MCKNDTLKFLFGLHRFGWKLGLHNITALLDEIGNPQKNVKCVHIAGTNGKGSTAAILERLCRESNLRTGLFTSPHLLSVTERIQVNGQPIPDVRLRNYVAEFRARIEKISCTFYETLTAIAFKYFSDERVDIGIIEVGLGGKYDATNVIVPELSIITEISFDHVEHLGKSLAQIASEKAGIIKKHVPCISQSNLPEVSIVIKRIAGQNHAKLYELPKMCQFDRIEIKRACSKFDMSVCGTTFTNLQLNLIGRHQLENAATAALALKVLAFPGQALTKKTLHTALAKVCWPGRMQRVRTNPDIIVDVAHNVSAMDILFKEIRRIYHFKRLLVMVGLLEDKQFKKIAKIISKHADLIFVTTPASDRGLKSTNLQKEFRRINKFAYNYPDIHECIKSVESKANKDDLICMTGSHYIVGESLIFYKKS